MDVKKVISLIDGEIQSWSSFAEKDAKENNLEARNRCICAINALRILRVKILTE